MCLSKLTSALWRRFSPNTGGVAISIIPACRGRGADEFQVFTETFKGANASCSVLAGARSKPVNDFRERWLAGYR